MISTDTTTGLPFTPAWLCDAAGQPLPGAPVFFLRAGGVIERGQMEAELSGQYRAGKILSWELTQAVEAGIGHLLAGDPELERVLAILADEGELKPGESLDADDARLLNGARAILAEHWPEYRDLVAQMARRGEIAPIVALRRFCTGWKNVKSDGGAEVPFVRGPDGLVAEQAVGRLSYMEMRAAGNEAYALCYADGDAGNFARPGSSAKDPKISGSDEQAPTEKDG